jgi:hypothetical protein
MSMYVLVLLCWAVAYAGLHMPRGCGTQGWVVHVQIKSSAHVIIRCSRHLEQSLLCLGRLCGGCCVCGWQSAHALPSTARTFT